MDRLLFEKFSKHDVQPQKITHIDIDFLSVKRETHENKLYVKIHLTIVISRFKRIAMLL